MAFWGKLKKKKTSSQESAEHKDALNEDALNEIVKELEMGPVGLTFPAPSSWISPGRGPKSYVTWVTGGSPLTPSGYTAMSTSGGPAPDYTPRTAISTWDLDTDDDKLIINISDNEYQIDRQTLLESIEQVRYHNYTQGFSPDKVFPLASLLLMYLDAVTKIQADD